MADMEARTEEMASAVLDTRIGPAWLEGVAEAVSYTHLTLPTIYSV